jgi:hypothetical protein
MNAFDIVPKVLSFQYKKNSSITIQDHQISQYQEKTDIGELMDLLRENQLIGNLQLYAIFDSE